MMWILLCILTLCVGVVGCLTLRAALRLTDLTKSLAESFTLFVNWSATVDENNEQLHALTRHYIGNELLERRLFPFLNYRDPEPSEVEKTFNAVVHSPDFAAIVEQDAKTNFDKEHGEGAWEKAGCNV
jgi:hypothetical protein